VVGSGSAGRRHLEALRRLLPTAQIAVVRRSASIASGRGLEAASVTLPGLDALIDWHPELAIVANPAPLHLETALRLAQAGVHVLVEKPLAPSGAGVAELIHVCGDKAVVAMVGYNLRFGKLLGRLRAAIRAEAIGEPVLITAEVGQHLSEWRPGTDYRDSVTANAELGGGVLLELSHELDYSTWLLGEVNHVYAVTRRTSGLEIDVEDLALVTLEFDSGAVGSVQLDMLRPTFERKCRVIGTRGIVEADLVRGEARILKAGSSWHVLARSGIDERARMEDAMLRHFLRCARTGRRPLVTLEDGARVVGIVEAAREASRTGSRVRL